MTRRSFLSIAVAAWLAAAALAPSAATADPALWRALADGTHVALMRHATAPGVGDPENFALKDCATQRNLSDGGRAEARAIGERFRAAGIRAARVLSSQWCRCLETARLLGLGAVEETPDMLNSSFNNEREATEARTRALTAFLANLPRGGRPVVLVSHQVNITALTGAVPRSGEIVVLRLGPGSAFSVAGRIAP